MEGTNEPIPKVVETILEKEEAQKDENKNKSAPARRIENTSKPASTYRERLKWQPTNSARKPAILKKLEELGRLIGQRWSDRIEE